MFDNYIVKGIGGFYYVKTGGSLVECKPKGIFRKKRITPVAGDIVRLETDGGAPSSRISCRVKMCSSGPLWQM